MDKWLYKLRAGAERLMAGRYGADHLNLAIVFCSLAVTLIGSLTGLRLLVIAADALLLLAFWRMLSRNRDARMAENRAYQIGRAQSPGASMVLTYALPSSIDLLVSLRMYEQMKCLVSLSG